MSVKSIFKRLNESVEDLQVKKGINEAFDIEVSKNDEDTISVIIQGKEYLYQTDNIDDAIEKINYIKKMQGAGKAMVWIKDQVKKGLMKSLTSYASKKLLKVFESEETDTLSDSIPSAVVASTLLGKISQETSGNIIYLGISPLPIEFENTLDDTKVGTISTEFNLLLGSIDPEDLSTEYVDDIKVKAELQSNADSFSGVIKVSNSNLGDYEKEVDIPSSLYDGVSFASVITEVLDEYAEQADYSALVSNYYDVEEPTETVPDAVVPVAETEPATEPVPAVAPVADVTTLEEDDDEEETEVEDGDEEETSTEVEDTEVEEEPSFKYIIMASDGTEIAKVNTADEAYNAISEYEDVTEEPEEGSEEPEEEKGIEEEVPPAEEKVEEKTVRISKKGRMIRESTSSSKRKLSSSQRKVLAKARRRR